MTARPFTTLFLDIGGVLLTNGWNRSARERAAEIFHLDLAEMDERHHTVFELYETDRISLDEYLRFTVFHRRRSFPPRDFKAFLYAQSRPFPEMIDLARQIRSVYNLKTAAVSNEGRELTVHRVRTFGLAEFIDTFVSSCFVGRRKPDRDIYRIALDLTQARPEQVVYIEDREMFAQVASEMGIHAIRHTGIEATCEALAALGLGPVRDEEKAR